MNVYRKIQKLPKVPKVPKVAKVSEIPKVATFQSVRNSKVYPLFEDFVIRAARACPMDSTPESVGQARAARVRRASPRTARACPTDSWNEDLDWNGMCWSLVGMYWSLVGFYIGFGLECIGA